MRIAPLVRMMWKQIVPASKKISGITYYTGKVQEKTAQNVIGGVKNLTRIVDDVVPEEAAKIQKLADQFGRYGVSLGDLKAVTRNVSGLTCMADNKFVDAVLKRKAIIKNGFLGHVTEDNKKIFTKFLNNKKISDEQIESISHLISEENAPILKQLLKDKTFNFKLLASLSPSHLKAENVEVLKQISRNGKVSTQEMLYILSSTNKSNSDIAIKLLAKSGDKSEGLSSILRSVYASEGLSEEGLKVFQLRKKLMTELLENPNFKLGTDARGSENTFCS